MEKCLRTNDLHEIAQAEGYGRIYYGAEFCQELIPSLGQLKKAFSLIAKLKKSMTLVAPYVTNKGISALRPLFGFLERQDHAFEVVVNDWGVLQLIRQDYVHLRPVLGRLLTKQKRDPEILNMDKYQKAPDVLREHFRGSVIGSPLFRDFLRTKGIFRAEIDLLEWEMDLPKDNGMHLSVHRSYAYITTTRFCALVSTGKNGCSEKCRRSYWKIPRDRKVPERYLQGNTLFYKTAASLKKVSGNPCINRVIDNPGRHL